MRQGSDELVARGSVGETVLPRPECASAWPEWEEVPAPDAEWTAHTDPYLEALARAHGVLTVATEPAEVGGAPAALILLDEEFAPLRRSRPVRYLCEAARQGASRSRRPSRACPPSRRALADQCGADRSATTTPTRSSCGPATTFRPTWMDRPTMHRSWRVHRGAAFAFWGGRRCLACGSRWQVDGHHQTYRHFRHERPWEVLAVCRVDHDVITLLRDLGLGLLVATWAWIALRWAAPLYVGTHLGVSLERCAVLLAATIVLGRPWLVWAGLAALVSWAHHGTIPGLPGVPRVAQA